MTESRRIEISRGMMELGYRDYIAARHLLNNEFYMQGLYLASSGIEKYLKAVIVVVNQRIKKIGDIKFHLNEFSKLSKYFKGGGEKLLDSLDINFMRILGIAYQLRYYDGILQTKSLAFLVKQFMWELDKTTDAIEKYITFHLNDEQWQTSYVRAVNAKYPALFQQNDFLNGQPVKTVMEAKSKAYFLFVNTQTTYIHLQQKFAEVVQVEQYEGKIAIGFVNHSKTDSKALLVDFSQPLKNRGYFDMNDIEVMHV